MKKKRILFICTGNSCRSQMAEGWVKKIQLDILEPFSAGIEKHSLDSRAVKVMAEAGVDISNQKSKVIHDLKCLDFDFIVTICKDAEAKCPVFHVSGKRLHRPFDNPPILTKDFKSEDEILDVYRRVRDEIKKFVEGMPHNLKS